MFDVIQADLILTLVWKCTSVLQNLLGLVCFKLKASPGKFFDAIACVSFNAAE
jgi:hypothetical protein